MYEGWTVPLDYDPMLSKLIVHAPDRASALARMRRALDEYFVGGVKTNLPLFRRILDHPDFVAARIDTGFLDRLLASPPPAAESSNALADVAAVSAALFAATAAPSAGNGRRSEDPQKASAWKRVARSEGVERL